MSAFPLHGSAKAEPPRELLLLPPGLPHSPVPLFPGIYLPVLPASSESKGGLPAGAGFGGSTEGIIPGEAVGLLLQARER